MPPASTSDSSDSSETSETIEVNVARSRSEITDLLMRYCRAIDTKDWALFSSCFVADCRTVYQGRSFDGIDRLTDVMRRLHDPLDASLHRLSNIEIVVSEPGAKVGAYVDALLVKLDHPLGPLHQVAGTYEDDVVRLGGEWRFRTRVFRAIWVSERGSIRGPGPDTIAQLHRVPAGGGEQIDR